jgi:2-polyprenyl-3-methyl-5-hydroxy-6-metoxy-1,4-benzoquinol methylase
LQDYLTILNKNYGFNQPEEWLKFASENGFKEVVFKEIKSCPYCEAKTNRKIGQFIYYSTLQSLLECSNCGLAYIDVLIDPEVRQKHFENTYKSEEYFRKQRDDIFNQTISLIKKYYNNPKSILELGGATGILGQSLVKEFPNTIVTINDISNEACISAQSKGLKTKLGAITSIKEMEKNSLILALDVLYYEENIKESLLAIYNNLEPDGLLILRLPNKFFLINQFNKYQKKTSSNILFFNPEHLYLFSQNYLLKNLKELGFKEIQFLPSVLLKKKINIISRLIYYISLLVFKLTSKVICPAMFVIVKK